MTYPKLVVDSKIIGQNVDALGELLKKRHVDLFYGVTKVFCGDPRVAQIYVDHGVEVLADSRVQNLKKLKDLPVPKLLLRLPQLSEIEDVVRYADMSLNSELVTVKALNDAAKSLGITHKVILMIDLGDLREGLFLGEGFDEMVDAIMELEAIELTGLGVNLTCYGAIIPKRETLAQLVEFKERVKERHGLDLPIVSGGNSSSVYLLEDGDLPGITNLRLGECLALGTESAYGKQMPGTSNEGWVLEAQVIEVKNKPSVPIGEVGKDAFGNVPTFEDRGVRRRAIIAIGKQDVHPDSLVPFDDGILILGASSDHMILDVTDAKEEVNVGDILRFTMDYAGVLNLSTSEYVEKEVR